MPSKASYVALSGFLRGMKMTNSGVNEFQVEIEKLAFLGKSFTPIATASRTCSSYLCAQLFVDLDFTASPATPAKRGLKFSFDTPTPAMKKARLTPKAASQAIASSSQTSLGAHNDNQELEYVDPQPTQGSSEA